MKMKILTVAMTKGGTGKTEVACNLAFQAARLCLRVLLIDTDIAQASATIRCGVPKGDGFSDWFVGKTDFAHSLTEVQPALSLLAGGDRNIVAQQYAEHRIRHDGVTPASLFLDRLQCCMHAFDLCIIDTSPGGTLAEVAVSAADLIISPVQLQFADVSAYATFEVLAARLNDAPVAVVPNRYDDHLDISHRYHVALRENVDVTHGNTVLLPVNYSVHVSRASELGEHLDWGTRSGKQFEFILGQIMAMLASIDDTIPSSEIRPDLMKWARYSRRQMLDVSWAGGNQENAIAV